MVRRSLKRRIDEIYSRLPPPPPPLEELPIEAWVAEIMEAHAPPPALYDEDFWSWFEKLPGYVGRSLRHRIDKVWGTAGLKLSPETATEIAERGEKVLPPYIDRYWRQFQLGKVSETRSSVLGRSYLRVLATRESSSPTPTPQRRSGNAWQNLKPSPLKRGGDRIG